MQATGLSSNLQADFLITQEEISDWRQKNMVVGS